MERVILHIIARSAWDSRLNAGEIRSPSLAAEGFIHFSTRAQVLRSANKHYHGQADLVVLRVQVDKLTAPLRWEAAGRSEPPDNPSDPLYPHLYGPLNLDAVIDVIDLPCEPDGSFTMPPALAATLED
ncbi:MAG: DUF952 domain-containing protein [Anaerolineae bacterium]|nr:DUF952 domain-containing protein [Chloroflexota bacterium]MBV6437149.1 hypothetical protein [Anaerolineae bacterium]MDL1915796.1 DUF952 domain-containing protein [Anaerolineae bacterium CFX4]OQY81011.1 MAG: hypothetical protein B6D42_11990 [Anaerolineae bacterium UTCFX5]MCO6445397.1 DUF952 domain-containing protein [Anaerolineae bacterium]